MTPDDQRHGQRAGYLAGCRTACCSEPNSRWMKRYRLAAYRNDGRTNIDPAPVRAHIQRLQKHMTLSGIAATVGSSASHLRKIMAGTHPTMRPDLAARILAVSATTQIGTHWVAGIGAQRRIQALAAIGYSFERIATLSDGCHKLNVRAIAYEERDWISSDYNESIKAVFDQLCMTPYAPRNGHERAGVTRIMKRATASGWAPPLAWDDETIDDPAAKPVGLTGRYIVGDYIDEAAVLRRMAGDRVTLTKDERIEVVRRLRAAQWTFGQIEEHTGLNVDRYIAREKAAA
jgi:hypothetical protein